jgi:hypothetical protein
MVIMVIQVKMTPATADPEYVWLREGKLNAHSVGIGACIEEGRRNARAKAASVQEEEPAHRRRSGNVIPIGSIGIVLQSLGLIWLLSAAGLDIPWYSVFPSAAMIAGGVFILRAIIHGRDRIETGASSDRRYHSRN